MKILKIITLPIFSTTLLLVVSMLFLSSVVFAATDKPLVFPYYDPNSSGESCEPATRATGKGYMIGDSITASATTDIISTLRTNNVPLVIDAVASRSLSRGGAPINGQSVLENSRDAISDKDIVIVSLGTNGGLTTANIQSAITAIKQANSNAKIFWVNIGVNNDKRTGNPLPAESWNETLREQATEQGFTVIDWASVVTQNPEHINDDGLGVHLSDTGRNAFAKTIATGLGAPQASGAGFCKTLPGSDNAERIWNFFIAKGWQPWVIAGIIGNMQAESGLQPMRYQSTPSGQETTSLSVLSRTATGGPAWGIVQWDPPTKIIQTSRDAGISHETIDTLEYQLQFLFEQLTGAGLGGRVSNEKSAGDQVLATTNVEQAALVFAQKYERCKLCGNISHIQPRINFAVDILNRFGSQ